MTITLFSRQAKVLTQGIHTEYATDREEGLGLAIDIGTTTIAAYLMDCMSGTELARTSMLNPQRIHGADVITRLKYSLEGPECADRVSDEIRHSISEISEQLLQKAKTSYRSIKRCCLVGNTVMMHLAGHYNAAGLSQAPFDPFYTKAHTCEFSGIPTLFGGCISGYVGADTVAAMLSCGMDQNPDTVLLIDIGTNGELVLKHHERFVSCSCAAGPAFEGAHITCGIGAIEGAIDHVESDGSYTTIGSAPAIGICGSGLVDAIAYLVENEMISPVGRMSSEYRITDSVYIAPHDVREVQLAKAAIAAGIDILVQEAGITYDQIDHVYLAGGFGSYIRVSSACKIGMLPTEIEDKIIPVGNAAGDGAKMMLLSKSSLERAETMRCQTHYIELSTHPDFEDLYTDHLLFGEI